MLKKLLFFIIAAALVLCLAVSFAFAEEDDTTSITSAEQLKLAALDGGVYKLDDDIVLKTSTGGLTADDFLMTQTAEDGKIVIDLNGHTLYVQQRINLGTASLEFKNGKIETRGVNLVFADTEGGSISFVDVDLVVGHKSGGGALTVFDLRAVDFDFLRGSIKFDTSWNGNADDSKESTKGTNGYLAYSGALFNIGSNTNEAQVDIALTDVDIDVNAPHGNVALFNFGTYKHGTSGKIYGPFTALPSLTLDGCDVELNTTTFVNVPYGGHTTASDVGLITLKGGTTVSHTAKADENDGVEGMFTRYSSITELSRETTAPGYVYIVLEEGVTLKGDASAVELPVICVSDADKVTKQNVSKILPLGSEVKDGELSEDALLLYGEDSLSAEVVSSEGAEYVTVTFHYDGKTASYKLPSGTVPVWHRGYQFKSGYELEGYYLSLKGIAGFALAEGGEPVESFEAASTDVDYYAVYEDMAPYWVAFDKDGALVKYDTSAMLNATVKNFNKKAVRVDVYRAVRQITSYPVVHDTVINLNGNKWTFSGARDSRFNLMTDGADLVINGQGVVEVGYGRGVNLAYSDACVANLTLNGVNIYFTSVIADWRTTGIITVNGGSINSNVGSSNAFSIGNKSGTKNYRMVLSDVEINLTENKDFIILTRGPGNSNTFVLELSGCNLNGTASSFVKADPTAYQVTVEIKSGTKLNNTTGKYFLFTVGNTNGILKMAEGCTFAHNLAEISSPSFRTYFWDFETGRALEGCGIVETGWDGENEKFIVTSVGSEIVWHVENVTFTANYFDGIVPTPPVDINALPPEISGDKLYLREGLGWSASEGGELLDEIPAASGNAHYFAVYSSTQIDAAGAIVDTDGFVSSYFEETSVSQTAISGNPDGYTLVLLKNLTYDEAANIAIDGKRVIIDLNGKTLTAYGKKDSSGATVGRINMGTGGSLIVKNGYLVFNKGDVATNIVYCDEKNKGIFVNFENVNLTFGGSSAFEMRGGELHLFGCSFKGNQLFTSGSRYAEGNDIFVEISYSSIECTVFGAMSSNGSTLYHPKGTYVIRSCDVTATKKDTPFFEVKGGKADANPSSTKALLYIYDSRIITATEKPLMSTENLTPGRIIPKENLRIYVERVDSNCPIFDDGVTTEFYGVARYSSESFYPYSYQDIGYYVGENICFDGARLWLNVYLDEGVFKSVSFGSQEYILKNEVAEDGVYKLTSSAIDVRRAAESIPIAFTYEFLGEEYTVEYSLSVDSCLSATIGTHGNEEERLAAFALLNYIIAAQEYFGKADESFIESYEFFDELYDLETDGLPEAEADTSAVAHVIYSAQLKLTDGAYLVLNLKDTESAVSVTVGDRVLAALDEGHGESTLVVSLSATDFTELITINAGGAECEYSAWAYLNRIGGEDNAKLQKLVLALVALYGA